MNEPAPKPRSGLRQRALTALTLAPLGIAAVLLLPTPWFALLLAVLFSIGLWEWSGLAGARSIAARAALMAFGVAAMAALWWQGRDALWWAACAGARR